MWTDSETPDAQGWPRPRQTFAEFLDAVGWRPDDIHKTFCHQVGRAHQRLLFESLGLEPAIDYSTFEYLGNTGSVALPMTAAPRHRRRHVRQDDRVALLGIGSGINVIMLAWIGSGRSSKKPPSVTPRARTGAVAPV